MKQTKIYQNDEDRAALERAAKILKTSLSATVRKLVNDFLSKHKERPQ